MTEHAPNRTWSSIDIPKTLAGVLAAVSAAVVGSYLGVAGTLVGAAVASLIGSVGTELYHRWIDRGSKKIRSTFVTAPAAVGTPPVPAGADEAPSELEPTPAARSSRRIRWGHIALVATGLFVLAMGTLTVFELVTGKSAADAVGNESGSSTTVCSVFCGGDGPAAPTPTPSESATPDETTPAPAETTTTEPTGPETTPSVTATTVPPTESTGDTGPDPGAAVVTPPTEGTE